VADFLTAFNQAYNTTNQVVQDFEIAKIARAKPQEFQGFTEGQGNDLRAAAERGDKVDIQYKDDGQGNQVFDRYVVTPQMPEGQAGPVQPRQVAMQGVTEFMGNRVAGSMSDDQVNSARQRAMAGVISRNDPVRGAAMMRDITRDERDTTRFGWERQNNERQIRLDLEADADKEALRAIDVKTGEWFTNRLTNPDGTRREATVDDHLAATQFRAAQLMAAGRTEAAGRVMSEYNVQSLIKIQRDTAERNEAIGQAAAALASGNLQPLQDFYNRFTPDGAQVTSISRNAQGQIVVERTTDDGRPLPPATLDQGQVLASLNSFSDPKALYNWSQDQFRNNLALAAERRAGVQFAQGQMDRRQAQADASARSEAAVAYAEYRARAQGRTLSDAERNAIRTGVIDAVPRSDGNAPAQVQLARAMVESGLAPDMATALDRVMSTPSKSARDTYINLMRPDSFGNTPNEARIAPIMEAVFGADWRDQVRGRPAGQSRAASPAPAPIARGQVVDGYEFRGGDPNDQRNWRQVNRP
jgi:hypothetical protein